VVEESGGTGFCAGGVAGLATFTGGGTGRRSVAGLSPVDPAAGEIRVIDGVLFVEAAELAPLEMFGLGAGGIDSALGGAVPPLGLFAGGAAA